MAIKTPIWILHGHSESGDRYPLIDVWDHKPTESEIYEALLDTDVSEFDEEEQGISWEEATEFGMGDMYFIHNGVRYRCYVNWDIVSNTMIGD